MKSKQFLMMAAFSLLSALSVNAESPVNIAQAAQITTLQAQVAALQKQVATIQSNLTGQSNSVAALQSTVAGIQKTVGTIQATDKAQSTSLAALQSQSTATQATDTAQSASVVALQNQVTLIASNPALTLGPFVSIDPNPENGLVGPHITFRGANIHIVSGSGSTNDNSASQWGGYHGLGNLIIGYDEPSGEWGTSDRSGSHTLVIGRGHAWSGFGGLVVGESNRVTGEGSAVLGGAVNWALGQGNVVIGGTGNFAHTELPPADDEIYNVVVGGEGNTIVGYGCVSLGGLNNEVYGSWNTRLGTVHQYGTPAPTPAPMPLAKTPLP